MIDDTTARPDLTEAAPDPAAIAVVMGELGPGHPHSAENYLLARRIVAALAAARPSPEAQTLPAQPVEERVQWGIRWPDGVVRYIARDAEDAATVNRVMRGELVSRGLRRWEGPWTPTVPRASSGTPPAGVPRPGGLVDASDWDSPEDALYDTPPCFCGPNGGPHWHPDRQPTPPAGDAS